MRFYRVSFVAGFAAGFVAGSRAGREKYDQLVKLAKSTAENPAVQQAAGAIQAQASSLASSAASKVGDRVPQIAQNAARSVGGHIPGLKHGSTQANGTAPEGDRTVAATNGHGKRSK